jgi:hypothetical protein
MEARSTLRLSCVAVNHNRSLRVIPQSRVVEGNVGDPDACGDTGAVAAVRAWHEARLGSD